MRKHLARGLFFMLSFSIAAHGCTVTIVGLRKEYRSSKHVFIGEFIGFSETERSVPPKLAEKWRALAPAKFRIGKSWKGSRGETADVFVNPLCECPMRELFPKPGDRFLVFVDRDGVVDSCNMSVIATDDSRRKDDLQRITDRLDSFWFRTWAEIYPF